MSAIPTKPIALQGGLDLVTRPVVTYPGRALYSKNHEPHEKGYARMQGYERFDGQPKPSAASYWIVLFDAGTAAISSGDTVTGATSGASGKALQDAVVQTGSYGGGNAAGYLVLTNVSGTFQDNEALQVAAVTKATAASASVEQDADGNDDFASTDHATFLADAHETARALIAKPTGSGGILGVATYGGAVYAWRNNAGGTAAQLHKSSTAGWVVQDLGRELAFTSGGVATPVVGTTLTGDATGTLSIIQRVIVSSGTFAAGTAAGRFIVNGQSGAGYGAENVSTVTQANIATVAGNSTANALTIGGRYESTVHNFGGHASTEMLYSVNGVNKAMEWNGTVLAFVVTGMTTDTPAHLSEHINRFWLTFDGGSLQYSTPANPHDWDLLTGSDEIGLGHEITGLQASISGVLGIFGRNKVGILTGRSPDSFDLDSKIEGAGAIEWSVQQVTEPIFMDDMGIRKLSRTAAFGDFNLGLLSRYIDPYLKAKRAAGVTVIGTLVSKVKNQYRVYFSDLTGLFVYFGRSVDRAGTPEIMAFEVDHTFTCFCTGEDSAGNEVIYAGGSDGYVYQIDSGNNFDGGEIEAGIKLHYANLGSPMLNKRWHSAQIDVDCDPTVTLTGMADFGYGDPDQPVQPERDYDVVGGGGIWNASNWNEFVWSAPTVGRALLDLEGEGTNCSIALLSNLTYEAPYVLTGLTLSYSERGLVRAQ